jgi:hypothetical protein
VAVSLPVISPSPLVGRMSGWLDPHRLLPEREPQRTENMRPAWVSLVVVSHLTALLPSVAEVANVSD